MDERTSQFFIAVAQVCEAAALAETPVRIVTGKDVWLEGIPAPPRPVGERGLDHTGYEDGLHVGRREIALHDVVEITLRKP